jgi:hypothetical protein
MNTRKPKLFPVVAPWMISASVPHLRLQADKSGIPQSATFIAYFQGDDVAPATPMQGLPQKVLKPTEFIPAKANERAPFHVVRVSFTGARAGRTCFAVSDLEVIREDDFDWDAVPTSLLPGETIEANIARRKKEWLETGKCLDPRMYEVYDSPWLYELGLSEADAHHYILLGHDEYVEVIASGWKWEKGQAA